MFSQQVIEKLDYYVYALIDPRDKKEFYIGKGCGNRVFNHIDCALENDTSNEKLNIIREIVNQGHKVKHLILRHGLTEKIAFEVEATLIDFIGLDKLSNLQSGHYSSDFGIKTSDEIISMYEAEELDTKENVILININRLFKRDLTEKELYDSTRKAWVLGEKRNKAKYAVATYKGLTREVYLIDKWIPFDNRWGFEGEIANKDIRDQLIYKSIKSYFPHGAANPIKYINCNTKNVHVNTTKEKHTNISENIGTEDLVTKEDVLLIKITQPSTETMDALELYEAARKSWVLGSKRNKVQYVAAIHNNIVKEVYKINEWYPCENRWAFTGKLAEESIRNSFINKSVKKYYPKGAVNPLKYLNI